jgi:hypothetical protein
MLFIPDIFAAGFAGLLFYLSLRIFEDGMALSSNQH